MAELRFPFVDLAAQQSRLQPELGAAMQRVLDHGRYIMGPEVDELEEALCRLTGAAHTVTCASGTDALFMALMALGVGPGDAVFVPSFTFAATAETVALLGATPVFVDIGADYTIDAESLRAAVDADGSPLRPVGVIPVDLFGQPADYVQIREIAEARSLWVLADAAQSVGGSLGEQPVGSLAPLTTTSFFPAKPLGCYGDGGAIFTDDAATADVLRSIRVHGQGDDQYDNVRLGITGRLDTLQAAVLLVKLTVFADELQRRNEVAARYDELLRDVVEVPVVRPGARTAWAVYTVLTDERDRLQQGLADRGIPSAVYYPRGVHEQSAYQRYPRAPGGLALTERVARRVISLPMHPYLEPDHQAVIAEAVREILS
jgi:dTDP-4-amino-4,6-dideoxygalactose transaminase